MDFSNKFKNHTNRFLLKALFYETTLADKSSVLYTLKDEDHHGFPSLYRLYMEEDDVTEYSFSQKYFHSWSHWEELCSCNWFQPIIEKWRQELAIRRQYLHIRAIERIAQGAGKDNLAAQKYLLERGWEKQSPRSKKKTVSELKELKLSRDMFNEDYERIMGSLN